MGPRRVYLVDRASGVEEPVELWMEWELTHGETWDDDPTNLTGRVKVIGAGWDEELKVYAVDDIQMVGRLMKLAGALLLGECERGGRELRTPDRPEPIVDAMQLF